MREGIMNEALAEVNKQVKGFMSHIQKEYGDVRPFNTEISEPVDHLYRYEQLELPENQDIKQQLIMKYGIDTYMEFEKIALKSKGARGL